MCNLKSCIRSWFHVHNAEHMRKGLAGTQAGASIPLRQWCISPLFQISILPPKKISVSWNFFPILPFPKKNFNFYPPKFLMIFLVINHKSQISPYFENFPPVLEKFNCFLNTLCVFRFPFPLLWPWCIYASPNARTGRPWPMYGSTLMATSEH